MTNRRGGHQGPVARLEVHRAGRRCSFVWLWLWLLVGAACQSPAGELSGLAEAPPLDYAVLISGGAFLAGDPNRPGTFVGPPQPVAEPGAPEAPGLGEPIPIAAVLDVLAQGRVFRRLRLDDDPAHRRALRDALAGGPSDPELQMFLQLARDRGYDLLLVVEELHDGPIDAQGINGRWPVTLITWILLGFGAVIPDHTFESRATLRVSVRDLQSGKVLYDPSLSVGQIELSLTERSDFWGMLASILVPPFWVGDDPDTVRASVREVVQRRLLVSLARDLKSESGRQRLRERSAASLSLQEVAGGTELVVEAAESISQVRLRRAAALDPAVMAAFEAELLASMQRDGERFRYRARLPAAALGENLQVLVGTIRGEVASATFLPGVGR